MQGNFADDFGRDTAAKLVALWATLHDTIVGAVEDGLGPRGLRDLLYQPLFEAGRNAAVGHPSDAGGVAEEIVRLEQDFDLRGRVLEKGPDRVVREVTECPWSSVRPASCRVFAWWMEGYCQGLNPAFRYRLEQLIPEGAATCVWSVSRQPER
jgi:hypothetical protein